MQLRQVDQSDMHDQRQHGKQKRDWNDEFAVERARLVADVRVGCVGVRGSEVTQKGGTLL
jgi:hypothetical protein